AHQAGAGERPVEHFPRRGDPRDFPAQPPPEDQSTQPEEVAPAHSTQHTAHSQRVPPCKSSNQSQEMGFRCFAPFSLSVVQRPPQGDRRGEFDLLCAECRVLVLTWSADISTTGTTVRRLFSVSL